MAVAKQSKFKNKEHKRNVADSSDNTAAEPGRHSQTAQPGWHSQTAQPDSQIASQRRKASLTAQPAVINTDECLLGEFISLALYTQTLPTQGATITCL